jgi:hypothetical protein
LSFLLDATISACLVAHWSNLVLWLATRPSASLMGVDLLAQ